MHYRAVFLRVRGDQRVSSQVAAQPGFIEQRKESLESSFPGDQQPHMIAIQPQAHACFCLADSERMLEQSWMTDESDKRQHDDPRNAYRLTSRKRILPPASRRAMRWRSAVVRINQQVCIGNDHPRPRDLAAVRSASSWS